MLQKAAGVVLLSLIVIVVIILFTYLSVIIILFLGMSQTTVLEQAPTKKGGYAIVTFSTDGRYDFLVEDARGRKADIIHLLTRSQRNRRRICSRIWPWQRIEEDGGTRIFETKVFNDYNFKITVYGVRNF